MTASENTVREIENAVLVWQDSIFTKEIQAK